MSNRDFFILLGAVLLGLFIGWGVRSCSVEPPQIKLVDDSKYTRQIDSIKSVLKRSKDSITVFKRHIIVIDSLASQNRKTFNHDAKNIKNLTNSGLDHYLDSLFKSAGFPDGYVSPK